MIRNKITKSNKKIATVFFLLPVFLYRLRYPFPYFLLGEYTVIIEIIGLTIMSLISFKILDIKDKIALLFINILLVIHTIIALYAIDYEIRFDYIFKTIRYVYYLSLTYVFAKLFFDRKIFIRIFINFTIVALTPFIFFLINDKYFSLHDYYANRFAGLFSEPSALAPFLTFLIILSLRNKKYYYFLLLCFILLKTDSGTSYIVLSITFMLMSLKFNKKFFFKLFVPLSFLGLISFTYILSNVDLSLLTSFKKIEVVLNNSNLESGEFDQARIQTLYNSIMVMIKEDAFIFGYGTNTWETITNKEQEFRIFNLVHFLVISFGIFSIYIFYFIFKNTLQRFKVLSFQEVCFMLSFLFATLLNSAQGVIIWKLFFVFLFVPTKSKIFNSILPLNQ